MRNNGGNHPVATIDCRLSIVEMPDFANWLHFAIVGLLPVPRLVVGHGSILVQRDFRLQRASSICFCQSTPR